MEFIRNIILYPAASVSHWKIVLFFLIKIDKEKKKKKDRWIDKIELILGLRDAYEKSGSLHVEKYITVKAYTVTHTQKC